MKAVILSFRRFVAEIFKDAMLVVLAALPVVLCLVFRIGIPRLESYLCLRFAKESIIADYYCLFDLTMLFMTPVMFGYSSMMVLLEERDCGIAKSLCITPLGRAGYLVSRLGLISLLGGIYGFILECFTHLSNMSVWLLFAISLMSVALSCGMVSLIVSVASNKVEGIAFSKVFGLLLLGPLAAAFLHDSFRYVAGILPSFWVTVGIIEPAKESVLCFLIALFEIALLMLLSVRKFCRTLK